MASEVHDAHEDDRQQREYLGERLRQFRTMRRLSLRELAATTGLSASFLSQLERGRTSANIGSVRRISDALGVSMADLFDNNREVAPDVLRHADRPQLEATAGARKYLITQTPLQHLEIYVGDFDPHASTGEGGYTHGDSQEVFFVIRGEVTLYLGNQTHTLSAGDSIEYRSSVPHKVVNDGEELAEVMWISSPPSALPTSSAAAGSRH